MSAVLESTKDFGSPCFHSASTGDPNANTAAHDVAQALDSAKGFGCGDTKPPGPRR